MQVPDGTRFVTQATGEDAARPDLEGLTDDGTKVCVIECKFWAGLTANQPVTYVSRLSEEQPGILAFIVPSMRLNALWGELSKRMERAEIHLGKRQSHDAETLYAELQDRHGFVLTSWRGVLNAIIHSMEVNGDTEALEDAKQLLGLCERMDQNAFLPFRSEEITSPEIPRLLLQLTQLTSNVCDRLLQSERFATRSPKDGSKLTAASSRSMSGRYMSVSQTTFMVCFDWDAWSRYMASPLWFKVEEAEYRHARRGLQSYCEATKLDNALVELAKDICVPLYVTPEIEADQLIEDICRQVEEICTALTEAEPATGQLASDPT